jgi:chemotaxis protein methyltransferase CheR
MPWPIRARFDVIFCRNTLIYFDRAMQQRILQSLVSFLEPDGLLFLGHAESVFGLVDGLAHLGNTIYQRTAVAGNGGPS